MQEVQSLESTIDAALLERLKQLRQARSTKMGVLTKRKNAITELMKDPCNVESVKAKMENEFSKAYNELSGINDAVKTLLKRVLKRIKVSGMFLK